MPSTAQQRPLLARLRDNRLTRPITRQGVAALALNPKTRRWLNDRYNRLGWSDKARFHSRFCEVMRHRTLAGEAVWRIDLGSRIIDWPLRNENLGLDWGLALAVLGHDADIKRTYLAIASAPSRPRIFVDAGANYGTHAILMAALGIPVLAFEPNARCRAYIANLTARLGLDIAVESCALGAAHGEAVLSYPEDASWLGTTRGSPDESGRDGRPELMHERASVRPLDHYLDRMQARPVLLKLDVEGSELAVLEGAAGILERVRPLIIFESNTNSDRPRLIRVLAGFGYDVCNLPWSPDVPASPLTLPAFMASPATNFLAVPQATPR